MTKLPSVSVILLLLRTKLLTKLPLSRLTMATIASSSSESDSAAAAAENISDYPVPLTPPYPALSKEIELRRAISASTLTLTSYPINILFEDEWISIVNKPAGIYCESILSSLTTTSSTSSKLHLANRLDRDTSGLIIVTKHNKVAARLVKAFTEHKISKTYLALAVAPVPDWWRIGITSGHGRSKHGAWRVYSVDDVDRVLPGGSRVKRMETVFEVLSVNGARGDVPDIKTGLDTGTGTVTETKCILVRDKMPAVGEDEICKRDQVLMRAYPKSGRTHQIRLHCQYLGLPLRGDVKYGGVSEWNGMECEFHALHAETLSFTHPITEVPLYFKAPLPLWVQKSVLGTDNTSSGL